ncbi:MAG: GNAT family N-acetyltransferase [Candidatus Delongbacteria bacterium]|nr:GNAT family N-acetyltransferase [Candidatus Delongbacteria bacterium]MBN2834076.1 GNAT family N-acetyltransferase [Candidatus Delongbacteria bacterium]
MNKTLFKKIDCLRLFVDNLDNGLKFYRDSLGLKLIWKTEFSAGLSFDDNITELVIQTKDKWQETDIMVDSVEEAVEILKNAGGKIVDGPFDIDIGKCAVVNDPWGNEYVILDSTKGNYITDERSSIIGVSKSVKKFNLKIEKASEKFAENFLDMCKEHIDFGESSYNYPTMEIVKKLIENILKFEKGDVPEGKLKFLAFWFFIDDKMVGSSRLRPILNEDFEFEGGHIGYDVRPSLRKSGIGTEILKLTLKKAAEYGLSEVIITCDDENVGSYKIIENNGGVLINKAVSKRDGKLIRRYKVVLY